MRYSQIIESEETDKADRDEAEGLFDLMQDWLEAHADHLADRLTHGNALGGCWVLQAKFLGPQWSDLLIIFAPRLQQGGSTMRGSFGHAGNRPVLVLTVLKGPSDLQYLDTRVRGSREIFLHEYQHYLAWYRNKRPSKTSAEALGDDDDFGAYYNHAEELNAYYQEGVSGFARLVQNVIRLGHRDEAMNMWGSKSTQELVADIMTRHINKDFVENLTPGNHRKIEKRVARFVEQTIRPMFTNTAE
jgi:hypothetical protein